MVRTAIWWSGALAVLVGFAAVFVVAPLALTPDLAEAYARRSVGPNLAEALIFGAAWLACSLGVTVIAARPASAMASALQQRCAGLARCLFVAGAPLAALSIPAAAMSHAVADAPPIGWPSGWPASDAPAWLLGWIGAGMRRNVLPGR